MPSILRVRGHIPELFSEEWNSYAFCTTNFGSWWTECLMNMLPRIISPTRAGKEAVQGTYEFSMLYSTPVNRSGPVTANGLSDHVSLHPLNDGYLFQKHPFSRKLIWLEKTFAPCRHDARHQWLFFCTPRDYSSAPTRHQKNQVKADCGTGFLPFAQLWGTVIRSGCRRLSSFFKSSELYWSLIPHRSSATRAAWRQHEYRLSKLYCKDTWKGMTMPHLLRGGLDLRSVLSLRYPWEESRQNQDLETTKTGASRIAKYRPVGRTALSWILWRKYVRLSLWRACMVPLPKAEHRKFWEQNGREILMSKAAVTSHSPKYCRLGVHFVLRLSILNASCISISGPDNGVAYPYWSMKQDSIRWPDLIFIWLDRRCSFCGRRVCSAQHASRERSALDKHTVDRE